MSKKPNKKSERVNPFDALHELMDDDASFADNAEHLYGLLKAGKIDLHLVSELLVEAAAMPIMAAENIQLRQALVELTERLNSVTESKKEERHPHLRLMGSQDGRMVEDSRNRVDLLKHLNGIKIN